MLFADLRLEEWEETMILERREKVLHIAAVQADYRDRRLYLSFGWLLIVWLLAALPLSGQTTAKDIEVAARAVAFLASKPSGSQTTAVVYAPGSADSKADADAIAAILAGGVTANKVTLEAPKVVTASELSSLSGVTVVFVARGMSAHYAAPLLVVLGTTLGMLVADTPAVFAGERLATRIPMKWVHGSAATLFALLGVATLAGMGARLGF